MTVALNQKGLAAPKQTYQDWLRQDFNTLIDNRRIALIGGIMVPSLPVGSTR